MANKSSQVLNLRALLPSSTPSLCFSRRSNLVIQNQPASPSSSSDALSLRPPSPAVVTESVLSLFGWAHRKKMCNSSTLSFIFPPGQRLGRTLMLPNKTAWMYVHAAEFWCGFEALSPVVFVMNRMKTGKTPLLQLLQLHLNISACWVLVTLMLNSISIYLFVLQTVAIINETSIFKGSSTSAP